MDDDDKFAEKYRIDSIRLPGYDYSRDGYYFVTVCAKNREEYFGRIVLDYDGKARMELSQIGKIVEHELRKIVKLRKNVFIDIYQIMPNHVHVIFQIDNGLCRRDGPCGASLSLSGISVETPHDQNVETPPWISVETPHRGRLYGDGECGERGEPHPWHKTEWKPDSLGSIVNQFKGAVTRSCRGSLKIWQPRFHDRIIRGEPALNGVRQYVKDNVKNWERDRNNMENIWM